MWKQLAVGFNYIERSMDANLDNKMKEQQPAAEWPICRCVNHCTCSKNKQPAAEIMSTNISANKTVDMTEGVKPCIHLDDIWMDCLTCLHRRIAELEAIVEEKDYWISKNVQTYESLVNQRKFLERRNAEQDAKIAELELGRKGWIEDATVKIRRIESLERQLSQEKIQHETAGVEFEKLNKELLDELKEANEKIYQQECSLAGKTRIQFKCKCGEFLDCSPIPMYEAHIKSLEQQVRELREALIQIECQAIFHDPVPVEFLLELLAARQKIARKALGIK